MFLSFNISIGNKLCKTLHLLGDVKRTLTFQNSGPLHIITVYQFQDMEINLVVDYSIYFKIFLLLIGNFQVFVPIMLSYLDKLSY